MKITNYISKAAFLTILIAGYQLPNNGLQNIAIAYTWLALFASVTIFIAVLAAVEQKKRLNKSEPIPSITITLNIATSLYFIYNEAIATGCAFLFATLFIYIANQMILDQKDEECTS